MQPILNDSACVYIPSVAYKRDGTAVCMDPCAYSDVVYDADGMPSCPKLAPAGSTASSVPCGRVAYRY